MSFPLVKLTQPSQLVKQVKNDNLKWAIGSLDHAFPFLVLVKCVSKCVTCQQVVSTLHQKQLSSLNLRRIDSRFESPSYIRSPIKSMSLVT